MPAARAAEAAGNQGKFWKMHDLLFENYRDLSDDNFIKWGKKLGLDMKTFRADLKSSAVERLIKDQQAQGVTLGARGTPAFFVNGRFLSGAQPAAAFEKLIDEELTKAKALVASGVSRADVYARTIEHGPTSP